jgi:anti-sigma factor ChrR (cupin superfamily)
MCESVLLLVQDDTALPTTTNDTRVPPERTLAPPKRRLALRANREASAVVQVLKSAPCALLASTKT